MSDLDWLADAASIPEENDDYGDAWAPPRPTLRPHHGEWQTGDDEYTKAVEERTHRREDRRPIGHRERWDVWEQRGPSTWFRTTYERNQWGDPIPVDTEKVDGV